ncbi:MAP7 domain-containing protein 2-like isoform X3 [Anguilla anguilla]|uniref:MAP7 domain-containing protein 2-like isoform X3 n=1 Tax=Anguilla anguilla TaxID=7936 RepID=UPI0015AC285A|nr:MAP7 domain-containing protein 2-like isoform X3 [Anguilla anguilla]
MAECAAEKAVKAPAVEVMSPPSIAEKRPQTNGHASPVRLPASQSSPAGKQIEVMTPPIVAEKKPQTNGHASPVRMPTNPSSPSGKQYVEGYLKTDDRMRLAKERREEREKSLVAREQAIREKERRAQLQYERTVEERWRRLEEQRQREELRRAAVEEKRRQRLEEEKQERLEALMRRSMERSLQLEQRPKRWTWGSTGGAREGDCENALPPRSAASALPHDLAASFPAASEFSNADFLSASAMTLSQPQDPSLSKRLSSSSAAIVHTAERAPPSPHRSPYRGSPGRGGCRKARTGSPGLSEENRGANVSPENLKSEKLHRERRTTSPGFGSPLRRPESPAAANMRSASPAASRIMSKNRAQSPCTIRDYPPSSLKNRSITPNMEGNKRKQDEESGEAGPKDTREEEANKAQEKTTIKTLTPDEKSVNMKTPEKKASKVETPERKTSKAETPEKISKAETPEKKASKMETPEKTSKAETPEKINKVDTPEKKASKAESPEKETLNVETPDKKMAKSSSSELSGDRSAEPSPLTPTGKPIAGTTDAEEASRLLAERRRQARLQKELEDKQRREQEEEERARVDELRRKQAEARARQEEEARQVEVEKQRQEQERKLKEEEERRHRECQERELQMQMDREKEEGELQAQKEAERQRQEREVLKLQEEQERLQRKKRIEEIMKRTRKSDAEMKKEEVRMEPSSPSSLLQPVSPTPPEPQGEVLVKAQLNAQMNGQVIGQPLLELGDLGGAVMKPTPSPKPVPQAKPQPAPPLINLEVKSTVRDKADEVESMEVSPVSKEELISIPEFSPVDEVRHNGMSNARAIEDLLDLTGHVAYPKLSPGANLGDCNKNLFEGFCSPVPDTHLTIQACAPSSDKRNIQ